MAEHDLTAPAAEPKNHDARDNHGMEGPVASGWELPRPGTYGSRQQYCQGGTHQRQALAGADGMTGFDRETES